MAPVLAVAALVIGARLPVPVITGGGPTPAPRGTAPGRRQTGHFTVGN